MEEGAIRVQTGYRYIWGDLSGRSHLEGKVGVQGYLRRLKWKTALEGTEEERGYRDVWDERSGRRRLKYTEGKMGYGVIFGGPSGTRHLEVTVGEMVQGYLERQEWKKAF